METYYARAFAELILLVSNARVIFTIKRYSFYKYSYVLLLYGLSLLTSAVGVFRYGNPVYGPKIKQVYDLLKRICANICLPFFVIEFYFYQLNMKSSVDSSEFVFESLFSNSKEKSNPFFQEVSKLIIPSRSSECNLPVLLFRLLGVAALHFIILFILSIVIALIRYFRSCGAPAMLNLAYIFSIFWFSLTNGTGTVNLWGLAVVISVFIDKFILSQHAELGWRLGIPVLLDELRILNLVFFTIFTAKALTD